MKPAITQQHLRQTLRLSGPLILGQLGQVMVMIADSIMVGQLGTVPLAAVSFGVAVFSVFYIVGTGISFALPPVVAESFGSNDNERLTSSIVNSLLINSSFAILALVFAESTMFLLYKFGQPVDVVDTAIPYVRFSIFSMLPFMIFQAFRSWSDGVSDTRTAMIAIITGNSFNIIFNYLFIFGKFGFPELGVGGAALSSLISRVIMIITWFLVIRNKQLYTIILEKLGFAYFNRQMLRHLIGLGFIMSLQMFFEVIMFSVSTLLMGMLGETQQAAHQIALNIVTISFMVTSGFSVAATIRVGNFLGKKEYQELQPAGNASVLLSVLFMSVSGLTIILFRDLLPQLYIQEIDVIAIASSMLFFAAIFQIPDGIQISAQGALRGLQDVRIPTLFTFISYVIFGIPIAILLAFHFDFGYRGIWIGLLCGLTVNALLMTRRFHRQTNRLAQANQKYPER